MWKQKLKSCQKETDWKAILAIVLFLALALVTPNVKVFFLLAFSLFGFLIFEYGFFKAFVYSVLPLSYISMAQVHTILVVPAKAIVSNQYWEGRHLAYGFSPYFFISLVAFLLIFFWKKKHISIQGRGYFLMALSFTMCGFLSASYASLFPYLSLLNTIQQLLSLTFAWYVGFLITTTSKLKNQIILTTIFLVIAGLIAYESLFVLRQTLTQSPVGIAIETIQFAPVFGLGSDESGGFRPFGLQAHPNGLANQQLMLICSLFLVYSFLEKKHSNLPLKKIVFFSSLLSLVNITLSLSRAAFLAIIMIYLLIWLRHSKFIAKLNQKILKAVRKITSWQAFFIIIILGFLFFKLSNRLLFSIYSFSEFGGVNTRQIQYAEAIEVFKKSPIIGIGDRMFIPTSYQLFPKGVMTYFPEEVHSGLLLTLVERGLIGMSIYLFFLLLLLKNSKARNLYSSTKTVLYSGIIAGLIMMIFHPERNQFSLFIVLTMAMLENKNDYKF